MKSAQAHRPFVLSEKKEQARLIGLQREEAGQHDDGRQPRENANDHGTPSLMPQRSDTVDDGMQEQDEAAQQQQKIDGKHKPAA